MNKKDMIHTRGLVVENGNNGFAQVVMDRKSACSGCDTGRVDKCRSCLTSAKIKARVLNPKGASKGDIVTVSMSRSKIMKGAASFYLIPVVFLIAGAFIGLSLGNFFKIDDSLSAMTGGFISLAAGFFLVRKLSERMNSKQELVPRITQVLSSGSGSSLDKKIFQQPGTCPGCK